MFKLDVISPSALHYSKDVTKAVLPGHSGDFGLLPNHSPLAYELRAGILYVFEGDDTGNTSTKPKLYFIAGGLCEFSNNHCRLAIEEWVDLSSKTTDALTAQKSDLEDELSVLSDKDDTDTLDRTTKLSEKIQHLELQIKALESPTYG